jgi:multidrug efflux system membrane fusion protein
VLTQIQPVVAIFTLPQKNLTEVREAMLRGPVEAIAFDQDNVHQLAKGRLLLIDNQIDQATSTIRLKAQFGNEDRRLWPGEFVRVRVLVDSVEGAITVPAAAVQRGPQGLFTWVIKPDGSVEQRPVETRAIGTELVIVKNGLAADDRVVVNGQYRLEAGARVEIMNERPSAGSGAAS